MAFENDPEGRRLATMYAGSNFDKPQIVTHEVFSEYSFDMSVPEFLADIAEAASRIPPEYAATARAEMADQGYDSGSKFTISYDGPESSETVAARIQQCEQYVATSRADELRTFERLKQKFGG